MYNFVVTFLNNFYQNSSEKSFAEIFPRQIESLSLVDLNLLKANNIRGIILDLDNTIISEDDRYLSPGSEVWINQAKQAGLKFFILSNGKNLYRVNYWSSRLKIPAIHAAKKPFSRSFRKALSKMQLKAKEVVVIGDSLHTDILGALLIGCPSIQVASLPHPFHWWEKLLGKYIQNTYINSLELSEIEIINYH
jgi:hypothetical protein